LRSPVSGGFPLHPADTLARVGITVYGETRHMKKLTKPTKALRRPLTQQDLAAVLGGTFTWGSIVQNGVGGTGKTNPDGYFDVEWDSE
jgi:hypothetical protein